MNDVDIIEVDNYAQFLAKANKVFDTNCLNVIPKNASKYCIKMFNTRRDLVEYLKGFSQSLDSYIVISGSLRDPSTDLVVLLLEGFYTDLDKVVIGGHYA